MKLFVFSQFKCLLDKAESDERQTKRSTNGLEHLSAEFPKQHHSAFCSETLEARAAPVLCFSTVLLDDEKQKKKIIFYSIQVFRFTMQEYLFTRFFFFLLVSVLCNI